MSPLKMIKLLPKALFECHAAKVKLKFIWIPVYLHHFFCFVFLMCHIAIFITELTEDKLYLCLCPHELLIFSSL